MLSVLRSRDFTLLFWSQAASVIGDALVIVALGLYVTQLTGNPSDVGLVLGSYAGPLCAFVLFGGVLADRLPRHLVMMVSDLVRAVLHGTLALLIVTGSIRIWQLVIIGLLFGTAEAFFRPAYTGLIPQTVPEGQIQQAQALTGLCRELAAIIGPAVATALVLSVGGAAAFGLDALTFVVSAVLLSRVRGRDRAGTGAPNEHTSVLLELREGWHAVRERAWVWATIAAFSVSLLVAMAPFFVLGATISQQQYGTVAVFGFANAAWGVGTVSGALVASRWRPRRPLFTGMLAALAWPAALALFAVGPPPVVAYAGMTAAGLGLGMFAVFWETALAQRIPPALLSRVSAWDWMGSLLLLPLGYLLAGPAAAAWGGVHVLAFGGAIGTLALAFGLLPRSTRTLLRLDDPAVQAAAALP